MTEIPSHLLKRAQAARMKAEESPFITKPLMDKDIKPPKTEQEVILEVVEGDASAASLIASLIQANYNNYSATTQTLIDDLMAENKRLREEMDRYRLVAMAFIASEKYRMKALDLWYDQTDGEE